MKHCSSRWMSISDGSDQLAICQIPHGDLKINTQTFTHIHTV